MMFTVTDCVAIWDVSPATKGVHVITAKPLYGVPLAL